MSNAISFIIPSINRDSLRRTIESIEVWRGDEVLVEFDLPPSGRWGNDQRNIAVQRAKGNYLAFIDDDDWYVKGHRRIMQRAMEDNPGWANLFRMQYPNGKILWETNEFVPGNIGSPMILVPNLPEFITPWRDGRNMADYLFVNEWPKDKVIWREEVIALLAHNDGEKDA